MKEESYLLWEVKADGAFARIMAKSKQEALNRAKELLPAENYSVICVLEYFKPHENFKYLVDKLVEKN